MRTIIFIPKRDWTEEMEELSEYVKDNDELDNKLAEKIPHNIVGKISIGPHGESYITYYYLK